MKKIRVKSEHGWSDWIEQEKFAELTDYGALDFGALMAVETSEVITADEAMEKYPQAFARFKETPKNKSN